MAKSNFSISVGIRHETNERINALAENLGMSKIEMVTRVIEWFGDQPEESQKTILGTIPKSMSTDSSVFMLLRMVQEGLVRSNVGSQEVNSILADMKNLFNTMQQATINAEVNRIKEATRKGKPTQ